MLRLVPALCVLFLAATALLAADKKEVAPVLNFKMNTLDGKPVELSKYQGKVVLLVNVASKCGNTPQYKGLQALSDKFGKDGFVVVGVPCNQFGGQEPGSAAEIAQFCSETYKVKFDMLEKVDVNGPNACPLYKHLTGKETNPNFAGKINWNFEKFLIGKDGSVVARFEPGSNPESPKIVGAIEAELKK